MLEVHHHRRPGARPGRGHRGQHPLLEGADAPVADARLEHAGAHRPAAGTDGRVAARRGRRAPGMAVGDVGGEAVGQLRLGELEQPVARAVVRLAVGAGGGDDVQAARRAPIRASADGSPAEPGRGGVDHRRGTRRPQRAASARLRGLVVELVAGQQRAHLEEVLVVVRRARARRPGRRRARSGPAGRPGGGLSGARRRSGRARRRWPAASATSNTSATAWVQPCTK